MLRGSEFQRVGADARTSVSQTRGWYVELEEVWTWKSVKLW